MKIQKVMFLGMILVLVVSLILPLGCSKEPGTVEPGATETEPEEYEEPEIFPDANLQEVLGDAMYEAMDKDTMEFEMAWVKNLNATSRGIADLTGLEGFSSLTHVYLKDNQITDITPLSRLFFLEELSLWDNQISDISALDSLIRLRYLFLAENQIEDVSPLSSLTSLHFLDLRDNQISDISALDSIHNVVMLDLRRNKIKDIPALINLTNLSYLYLAENRISDISPLVENGGLGKGDLISLEGNDLDLKEGSEDMENIRALEARGVEVRYIAESAP